MASVLAEWPGSSASVLSLPIVIPLRNTHTPTHTHICTHMCTHIHTDMSTHVCTLCVHLPDPVIEAIPVWNMDYLNYSRPTVLLFLPPHVWRLEGDL